MVVVLEMVARVALPAWVADAMFKEKWLAANMAPL
jgi:hypothetical protein